MRRTIIPSVLLFLILISIWVLSLRPVRLKIADHYNAQGHFTQAVNWYTKVLRKEALLTNQSNTNFSQIEKDVTTLKLKRSLQKASEETLFRINQILRIWDIKDFEAFLANPDFLLSNATSIVLHNSTEELKQLNVQVGELTNITGFYAHAYKDTSYATEFNRILSILYFLNGVIEESQNQFLSADSSYQKAANAYAEFSSPINYRRNKILPDVADEYFRQLPSIKRTGNANVLLESESPLIVRGIGPGPGNYLEYENCEVRIITQKYSIPRLKVGGEVHGESSSSCIIPRVVFWGSNGYLGEKAQVYTVTDNFDIYFPFTFPDGTLYITPRITFDNNCFLMGQKILIKEFKWN